MKKCCLIVCFLLLVLSSAAQQLIFKTYTIEDGLVANPVRCLFQDSRGFMWIGTWEGFSKYDGHKFSNYNTANGLSHNLVNDFYESQDGKLYIAENDGTVDILKRDAIVQKAAFSNVLINQFYKMNNGRVLAMTDTGGIHELRNGNLIKPIQKLPYSTYGDIIELNDSLLLGGTQGSIKLLTRQFDIYAEVILPKKLLVQKIYRDSKKQIWAGTNEGLMLLSPMQSSSHAIHFKLIAPPFPIPVLKDCPVRDLMEDRNGNLWVATSKGLVKIFADKHWQLFSEAEGLPSSDINCILQDKENNIWIGTTLGLSKLVTKNNIRVFTDQKRFTSVPVHLLFSINQDNLMTGRGSGLAVFNIRENFFTPLKSVNKSATGVVENSRPLLLFGNDNHFRKYDSLLKNIVDFSLPASPKTEVYCAVMDANGIIFSGTQKGLVIRSGGTSWYENKMPHRITSLLLDNEGYIWAGTWNNGLFRIKYTFSHNGSASAKPLVNGVAGSHINLLIEDFSKMLPDKAVRCLFRDSKANIWVGTRYAGIMQLKKKENKIYDVQKFDLKNGLMSNWCRVITEDLKNCIWVGSNQGIDKLIPQGSSFRVFNFSRVNNYFDYINAIVPRPDSSLWLGSNKGLVNIIDDEMEKAAPLPIYITSVNLGDTGFNYNTYHHEKKVQLKYNQNQAAFEFSSPGFINEKQILYSYRLTGTADTMWSQPANLHNVSYASLESGNYLFEVRSMGWNGKWSVPAHFSFSINKPYWKTWWFYSLLAVLCLCMLYVVYRNRISQLMKLQNVRNRIASDLHDDIGSTLTNINMLSEISRKNLHQTKEAEQFLNRISEEVTATSQALNDIIWSVNSKNDSIEEIFTRMRRYAADLFDNSHTICHLHFDQSVASIKLNMEQRRDLYLIYKELLNNIVKHADAKNIWIHAQVQNNRMHLKIKDDGAGFHPERNINGNGLKNILARTRKWKGNTTITAAPGKGTHTEIEIPLAG